MCHKSLKIGLKIKNYAKKYFRKSVNNIFMPENIFDKDFSIVKMTARKATIFPEKILIQISFKMHQNKTELCTCSIHS